MESNGLATIQQYVGARRQNLEAILPKSMSVERFSRIALASIAKVPKLSECSAESLYVAMHSAAQLGLEPNGPLGHAFLIPFWNAKKNCYECQFQAGWRGLVALAERTCGLSIWAYCVYKGDTFKVTLGTAPDIKHEALCESTGDLTHVYAVAQAKDGRVRFEVMSINEVKAIMARSKSRDREGNITGPWITDFGEMARKTVVKRLCKWLPISLEMADAIDADNRADFEDIQEVVETAKATRTEQLKEQLRASLPIADSDASESVANQNSSPRHGRKPKNTAATTPGPITPQTSDNQSTAAQPGHVAEMEIKNKTEEVILVSHVIDIGAGKTKFIDQHENTFYTESLPITETMRKAHADGQSCRIWWTLQNTRAMVFDAKIEE